jgi:hypothetical protein
VIARWTSVAAVLIVLGAYVHFGSDGTWSFRRVSWERGEGLDFTERYYAGLAEGFLRGRLDLPYAVDPRWQQVTNAYDYASRAQHGLAWAMWDASYYGGRFYLYFSPVPVVLFYLPFRWVARGHPPDALAAVFFAAWAFLASVAFARRALTGRARHVPFAIWILLIGLGNVVPWTLKTPRAYEVAVMAGMAMTASFAYALLRWTETGAVRHAVWMGLWLALAMATRPNLLVLLPVAAFVLLAGGHRKRAAACALIPLGIVAAILGAYNFARFDRVFELGMTYQISYRPMWRVPPCSLCDGPEAIRFVNNVGHYVFWAPSFASTPPYAALRANVMDPAVSFAGGPEPVGGIGALSPLTLAGAAIAILFALRRGDAGLRAPLAMMAAGWLIVAGLSTCRWVTARYALDFMMLMTTATVVLIEHAFAVLAAVRTRVLALIVSLLAMYAVVVAGLLAL